MPSGGEVLAVWMLARSNARRRVRSVLVLAGLVALVAAVVMATIAGARRTDSALDRFAASSGAATINVITGPRRPTLRQLRAFSRLPGVSASAGEDGFDILIPDAPNLSPVVAVDAKLGTVVDRARVIAGRATRPSSVDEITIGETLARQLHRGVGGHLDAISSTPAQVAAVVGGATDPGVPAGPRVRLHIVGIVRRPEDLGVKGALGGVLILTPAFDRRYGGEIGSFGSGLRVRTRDPAPDIPRITAEARRIFGPSPVFSVQSAAGDRAGAENAIGVAVAALSIFAGVAAAAGLIAVGIGLTREVSLGNADTSTLRALGLTRAQHVAASAAGAVLVAVGGSIGAVMGALALSPLFPIGVARRADPDLGFHADWLVLAVGVVAALVLVLTVAVVAAVWASRPSSLARESKGHRSSAGVVRYASRAGLPPTATNGLRMALQPGRGSTAVPVRSAILGAVFGVFGITAVLVFASSFHQLTTNPRRFGWTWDFSATDIVSNASSCSHEDFGLLRQSGVGALGVACYGNNNIQLDGRPTNGWAFASLRGTIEPTIIAGRAPEGPRDVALGSHTLQVLGKHIGDHVHAAGPHGSAEYQIVGETIFPTLGQPQPIADGAAFTTRGFAPIFDQDNYYRYLLGRFAPGAHRATVEQQISAVRQLDPPTTATLPVELDRLHQVDWLPATLAALLAVLALIAVVHALVTAVRRRRHELALLRAIGFDPRQVRTTVAYQATTLGTIGLVLGIPFGVIGGSLVWRLVAEGLGVAPTASIPILGILVSIPVVLLVVNLVAYIPARSAGRVRPGIAFQAE